MIPHKLIDEGILLNEMYFMLRVKYRSIIIQSEYFPPQKHDVNLSLIIRVSTKFRI